MPALEGPCRGGHTMGCSRIGRALRLSSNTVETKEDLQIGIGKVRVWKKSKVKIKDYVFDQLDTLKRP